MAKDYKDNGKAKRSGGTPGIVWLIGGFALGVVVTVLYRVGTPLPVPVAGGGKPAASAPASAAAPAAAAPAKFTFYDILSKFTVPVPGQMKPEHAAAPTAPSNAAAADVPFLLQVGAFHTEPEADKLRAQLALLGVEARIQKAVIDDKVTWFRVRVGPVKDPTELAKLRQRLDENSIKYLPLPGTP